MNGFAAFYKQHRPLLHYSAPQGWINDPNGLLYHRGFYHLYYQYFPHSADRGPMHWGHARSQDLFHWETLPPAIFPDERGEIFSGSLVADENNTSGFGSGDSVPLVAVFTQHKTEGDNYHQVQSIAYSLDDGTTYTMYKGNPVLTNQNPDFRDPKVFWHRETGRWIMPVMCGRQIQFFTSENLRDWRFTGSFTSSNPDPKGPWECPDLSLVVVEDSVGRLTGSRWVLTVSVNSPDNRYFGMQYFVGDFDGSTFVATTSADDILLTDFGVDNYAAVTFEGIEDRVISIGWMNCWHYAANIPATDFRGAMTVPRELTLRETPDGLRLIQRPVRELYSCFKRKITLENIQNAELPGSPILLELTLPKQSRSTEQTVELIRNNVCIRIIVDKEKKIFTVDRRPCGMASLGSFFYRIFTAPYQPSPNEENFSILLDTTSAEIFAVRGETVGTFQYFIDGPFEKITFSDGAVQLKIWY